MQQIFSKAELQKVQNHFCTLSHLFAYCVDMDGQRLTEMSGDEQGIAYIRRFLSDEDFYQVYKRIADSTLEDILVEPTRYANLKLAAVCVTSQGSRTNCWLLCAVIKDAADGQMPEAPVEGITMDDLYHALDMLACVERKLVQNEIDVQNARCESQKSKYSETEMSAALRRTEAMTEVVQYLESTESFEDATQKILKIVGEYLEVSAARLFQVEKNEDYVDLISFYQAPTPSRTVGNKAKGIPRGILLGEDKPLILSANSLASAGMHAEMLQYHIKAVVVLPVYVNKKPAMYFCVIEHDKSRVWRKDEIKFISDVVKVVQSLLDKRIQNSSLVGSYASLQEILDNVGTCIYVKDSQTGKALFANKLFKQVFAAEIRDDQIDSFLELAKPIGIKDGYYEICHEKKDRWYDMYHVLIRWIDMSQVHLYALYDVTDKKVYQKKIEQQAYTDFLTGLYNRMCCERDLARYIDLARQNSQKGALLYLDLDDFKHINDGLGHQYGDVLLQSISQGFVQIKGIEDTCYRMGGDEFVIIVPPKSYHLLDRIVSDIRMMFSRPWMLKDAEYYCTMSMGVCVYPEDGDNVADLIKKADIAMYEAKTTGKNRVARFSDKLSSVSSRRLDMEKNMRDATVNACSEFAVFFQPIMDVQKEGSPCVGAEALVRWNSAALGFISPADFIPLAEYLGLITPIGTYVLREACYACRRWNKNGHPEYKVNVNLSVVQLLQNDIVDVIKRALTDSGLAPENLTLEVTESLAINDMERMQKILNAIRALGVRIALDDFGTGYSSLKHIREIPLDVIKVDQIFVKDLTKDEYSQSFIKMVAELAAAIDVNVCVEGIETREQFEVLEGMKVQMVQGYFFDKPLPQEAFEEKYVKSDTISQSGRQN